jgi:ribosomal protein S18 acetylase RimI-like enzyme
VCVATYGDLSRIVEIHQAAFPGFLMTQLGPGFLREYYKAVLDCPGGILLIASEPTNRVIGFVSGAITPSKFYGLLRTRRLRLALRGCGHLVVNPGLWSRVFQNVSSVSSRASHVGPGDGAELASLAVDPVASGMGYGASLVSGFIHAAREGRASSVYLTTDAAGNDKVNQFYRRLGFQCSAQERRPGGRSMNRYEIKL